MRYDLTVEAACRICGVELGNLHADVNAATRRGRLEVPASAYLTEVSLTRRLVEPRPPRIDQAAG